MCNIRDIDFNIGSKMNFGHIINKKIKVIKIVENGFVALSSPASNCCTPSPISQGVARRHILMSVAPQRNAGDGGAPC